MQTQYFFERQSISQLFIFSAGVVFPQIIQLEAMIDYKYPTIASGATPIGSAGRALDRNTILRERIQQENKKNLEPMIDYKYPTIASGATPIGSAGRAPDDVFS
jgi:hypothetical protein